MGVAPWPDVLAHGILQDHVDLGQPGVRLALRPCRQPFSKIVIAHRALIAEDAISWSDWPPISHARPPIHRFLACFAATRLHKLSCLIQVRHLAQRLPLLVSRWNLSSGFSWPHWV